MAPTKKGTSNGQGTGAVAGDGAGAGAGRGKRFGPAAVQRSRKLSRVSLIEQSIRVEPTVNHRL